MKRTYTVAIICLAGVLFVSARPLKPTHEECDVLKIYTSSAPPSGMLVKTEDGDWTEVEKVLLPAKLPAGKYSVTVKKEDQDLYSIDYGKFYIKTYACYEYSLYDDAVLDWNGYSGTIIFTEN